MSNMSMADAAEAAAKAGLSGDQGLSFGPFIMSLWANGVLSGIMFLQFWSWWRWFSASERMIIKIIVYFTAIAGLAQTVFTIVFNMHLFAYGFGSYAPFLTTNWLGWPPLMDCVIGTVCQAVYVDRAYRLNNRNILILIIGGALMLVSLAGGTATVISFINLNSQTEAGKIYTFVELWLSATITIDVLIVACVGYGLWKSKTGWTHTDALVQKLIVLSLETQLTPTVVSLAFLIVYVHSPASTVDFFFATILSKVYAVGLYAVLNSRHSLRRNAGPSEQAWQKKSNSFPGSSKAPHQTTVHVTQDTYVESYNLEADKLGVNHNDGSTFNSSTNDLDTIDRVAGNPVELDYKINTIAQDWSD